MSFLRKLFARKDPFAEPCQCGGRLVVRVAPEREWDSPDVRSVCAACLTPLVADALQRIGPGWVVVQPFAGTSCHVPYLLSELENVDPWSARLETLLPAASATCAHCGATANRLLWIETEKDTSLRAFQDSRAWFDDKQGRVLCASCLPRLVTETLATRECQVWELVLPSGGPAVWLPWGY